MSPSSARPEKFVWNRWEALFAALSFEILTWMLPVPPSATVFPAWSTLLSLVLNGFVASAAVPMPRSVRFCRLVMATTPAAQAVPLK